MKILKVLSIFITLGILFWVGTVVTAKIKFVLKPKDLGIVLSPKNYDSFLAKAKTEIGKMAVSKLESTSENNAIVKTIDFEDAIPLKETFTQEEISARITYSTWENMPLKNTQIKVHKDGTVEVAGILATQKLAGFIEEIKGGINISNVNEIISYTKKIPVDMPVHILFKASVTENVPSIDLKEFSVATQPIDLEKYGGSKAAEALTSYIFMQVPEFYAKSVTFEDGKMSFEGRVPKKILFR